MVDYTHTNRRFRFGQMIADMTNDIERLKEELKGRGDRIAALQKIINGQFDIMTSNKTQIGALLVENANLKEQNVYFSNELAKERTLRQNAEHNLRMHIGTPWQSEKMEELKTENEALVEENSALAKKNAQLTLYNENQAKTIAAMMNPYQYNVSPFYGYKNY